MSFKYILTLLGTIVISGCSSLHLEKSPPSAVSMDSDWRFHKGDLEKAEQPVFDDSGWESVSVPHTWNTLAEIVEKGRDSYLGASWYRRDLNVDQEDITGKRLFLRFDGALTIADVYVNGEFIMQHRGGYSAFCAEITKAVKSGKNSIAVRVDNALNDEIAPSGQGLFTRWGGIYRPVTLLVKDATCITPLDFASPGVYLKQESVTKEEANLVFEAKISNGLSEEVKRTVSFTVKNAKGKEIATVSGDCTAKPGETTTVSVPCTLQDPHLWQGRKDPYLYSVTAKLMDGKKELDRVVQPLGLRFFSVDPEKGFFLNGEHLSLHGVCRHQEWEQYGSALKDEHHEHDVSEIYEIGATCLRLAHYQQADKMYELCDKNGIIVWAELVCAGGWSAGPFQENCKQQLTELIRQNYNHPAIVFWGLYNESGITAEGVQELHDLAHREDSSRLTTAGSNKSAWKKHRVTDTIAWNKYPGWYGEFDSISAAFKKTREKNPNMCIAVSEVGAGGCIDQHRQTLERPNPMNGKFYPEEYQSYVHERVWDDVKDDQSIWGYFVWNMFDFGWPIVNRGNRPRVNHKGLVTYDRKVRKDSFYFYQANWSEKPVLYLTSKRHAIRGNDVTPVKVYSNVGAVTLKVNGKPMGIVDANDVKVARWDEITLKEGDNLVEVSAEKEGVVYTDSVTWKYVPGAPVGEPEVSYTEGIYSASHAESGNGASKAFDGDMKTRWSSSKKGSWVGSELPAGPKYDAVTITWYQGAKRKYPFKVEFSLDGHTWDKAFEGVSSGKEVTDTYVFDQPMEGYHVRVTTQGSNASAWSSIYEIVLRKSED